MRKTICLLILVLLLGLHGTVWAMDFDFDDLFGDDLLMELDEEGVAIKPEEALLVQEGIEFGGTYNLSVRASRTFIKDVDPWTSFSTNLGSQFYVDARPDPNFRIFGKVGLNYTLNKTTDADLSQEFKLNLVELFSDFNHDNKVFFRAGKQNAKWGVGYFFSPADVISIGRLDPQNPKADREGPIALKIHYPRGSTNYYLYTLFDGVTKPEHIALAPKLEFVLGKSEIGLGGFYQKDKAPRLSATVSSSLGNLALFGEVVVSKGSDKGFVQQEIPFYPIRNKEDLFFHATVGAGYSHNDPDGLFNLTSALQYYYNGEGYEDQELIRDFRKLYALLLIMDPDEAKKIVLSDMSSTGRHYLAATLAWNRILGSKFSASAFWTTNLSDGSGLLSTTLSLPAYKKISPSLGVSFNYGKEASEFGLFGKNTTVFMAITLGSGSF